MILQLLRKFHIGNVCRAADTSVLAKLRKKTGYTIANCKKALEMHANNIDKAEAWLHGQAKEMGWAKATKLAGRTAAQGLVAVRFDKGHGILVEINCETDFVARNEKFQKMIEDAANVCYKFAHTSIQAKGPLTKMCLDAEQLAVLPTNDGSTLGEKLVLMIGSVGENAVLKRATCWKANDESINISAYTHPGTPNQTEYSAGKYGAVIAYKLKKENNEIGRQVCQHIVGLDPKKIGEAEVDKPAKNSDDETCLIYQEYLLDPIVIVKDVLQENEMEVIDFVRYSCGECSSHSEAKEPPLEHAQKAQ